MAQERDGVVQLLENRSADMNAHIRNLEEHANAEHDAYRARTEETFEVERAQYRRELQAVRTQCGDAQVRVDILLKAESMMEEQIRRYRGESQSGRYPAADAAVEGSEKFLRAEAQVHDLERQNRDLRNNEAALQVKFDALQRASARAAEQSATKTYKALGSPDTARLQKDVQEYN